MNRRRPRPMLAALGQAELQSLAEAVSRGYLRANRAAAEQGCDAALFGLCGELFDLLAHDVLPLIRTEAPS